MKKNKLRVIIIILILLWMRLVFGLSGDNGEVSSSLSYRIAKFFTHQDETARVLEPIVRKLAHLSEYAARTDFYFMVYF